MEYVKDLLWKKGISASELMEQFGNTGFQSTELQKASDVIIKMKKEGAKIILTFTSNLVTSGLRGLLAQTIKLGMADIIVTTVGGIEEDIMKATGEKFLLGSFYSDDLKLHEKGNNRVGNLIITNETYCKFEDMMLPIFQKLYEKQKRWATSDMLKEIGLMLNDENSIMYQAAKNNVPIFCPGITDGALGFHLFMFQEKHKDFIVDPVMDFKNIIFSMTFDEKKGVIALGGGIAKHHAIFSALINGGLDYAVYVSTAHHTSGSMSGATTQEAKSWGKVKDDSDNATVVGDATICFPLIMSRALDKLSEERLINEK